MRFPSKKNIVHLKNGVIIKHHRDRTALCREAEMLTRLYLSGLSVPMLLAQSEDTLRLEYIEGTTYADLVEVMTRQIAEALSAWLADYQRITGLLRGDVNLRNFIWTGTKCVGVDFEDPPAVGEKETDQGKIIAFAVTYNPAFSINKAKCTRLLLQAFLQMGGDRDKIQSAYLREISAIKERRNWFPFEIQEAASFFAEIGDRL